MVVKILYKIGKKGFRISKSGIVFKQVKGFKGATARTKLLRFEKKYGAKNLEIIKKGKRSLYFVRTGQKVRTR